MSRHTAANRSMPTATVIPELPYPDARAAATWLAKAFGFSERLRIGRHRVQLALGPGAVIAVRSEGDPVPQSILVRVDDVDRHCDVARGAGATIVAEPANYPYGERQYTAVDVGGHRWTFSESIADVDPADWGGELVDG
jgi:uncharacterized glyoxalase superfamily protein PhnB